MNNEFNLEKRLKEFTEEIKEVFRMGLDPGKYRLIPIEEYDELLAYKETALHLMQKAGGEWEELAKND